MFPWLSVWDFQMGRTDNQKQKMMMWLKESVIIAVSAFEYHINTFVQSSFIFFIHKYVADKKEFCGNKIYFEVFHIEYGCNSFYKNAKAYDCFSCFFQWSFFIFLFLFIDIPFWKENVTVLCYKWRAYLIYRLRP